MNPLVHFRWYRRWRGGVWGHHSALLHPWKTWTRFDYRPDDFSERLGDEDWRALPTPNFCEACAMDLATCDCAPRPAVVVVRVPPNPCYTAPPQHHTMTTDEALLTADGHGGDTTQALAVLAAEVRQQHTYFVRQHRIICRWELLGRAHTRTKFWLLTAAISGWGVAIWSLT